MTKWISVKKEPPIMKNLICLAYSDNKKFRWVFEAEYLPENYPYPQYNEEYSRWAIRECCEGNTTIIFPKKVNYVTFGESRFYNCSITHWMLMPKLPWELSHE